MYGVGPSVANVTANGEEIIEVTETGLCEECMYKYDNFKKVKIYITNNKVTSIKLVVPVGDFGIPTNFNYTELTEDQRDSWFNDKEKQLLTQDALKRYKSGHIIYKHKDRCGIL